LDSKEVVLQQAAIAALGEIKDIEPSIISFACPVDDWLVRQRLAEAPGQLPVPKAFLPWNIWKKRQPSSLLKLPSFPQAKKLKHPVNEEKGIWEKSLSPMSLLWDCRTATLKD